MAQQLRVLFVVSEAVPYAKTGGLADVAGALPYALKELGADVKVLMPYYGQIKQKQIPVTCAAENLTAAAGPSSLEFNVLTPAAANEPFYFVERDEFFERGQLYGTPRGDYFDNAGAVRVFVRTVLPFCRALAFAPDVMPLPRLAGRPGAGVSLRRQGSPRHQRGREGTAYGGSSFLSGSWRLPHTQRIRFPDSNSRS